MNNEELRQKYRFLKLVTQLGGRTYHAVDGAGHVVMVHYLTDIPDADRLLGLLDGLGSVDRRRIVERLSVDDAPVVVTEFIQGFKTFSAWLQSRSQGTIAPSASDAPSAPKSPGKPSEFTQLFGPSGPSESPPPDAVRTAPILPASSHPAPTPAAKPAGGMTQLFGPTDAAPPAKVPDPPAPAKQAPPAPKASEPPLDAGLTQPMRVSAISPRPAIPDAGSGGGFTQMFGAAGDAPPPGPTPTIVPPSRAAPPHGGPAAPPPAPPTPDKPHVRWRESPPEKPASPPSKPAPAAPRPEPPASKPAPKAPTPAPKAPGEFTRLFGGGQPSGAPPVSPPPSPSAPATFAPPSPPPPSAGLGTGPGAPAAPGEFTQLFQPKKKESEPAPPKQESRDYVAALHGSSASPSAPTPPPPPPRAAPKEPGEFTRLMAGGLPSTPPPPPKPAALGRAFESTAPPPPSVPAGPSEFTRIISAAAPHAPTQAPPTPPAAPRPAAAAKGALKKAATELEDEPPASQSRLVLFLALGLVGLVAVALVLFVVMRAKH